MTSELQNENTVTFVELLDRAEGYDFSFSIEQRILFDEKIARLMAVLYSEKILPTRRSCQNHRAHRQFTVAVLIAAEEGLTIDFSGCRSTTQLAVLHTASMLSFSDELVKRKFWSSDVVAYKALGLVTSTEKLLKLIPVVTLEDLIQ